MEDERSTGLREWYRSHRPVADAVLIALFSLVAAALGLHGVWSMFSLIDDVVSPWMTLWTALPGCILVFVKRRFPITSLLLAGVLFVVDLLLWGGIGPFVVLLDVLWTAAFFASPRERVRLLLGLAAATAGLFAAALVFGGVGAPLAFLVATQFGAFVGTDYWWAVAVSQAHELADLQRQRADEAAAVAERDRAEAVRREREAMARELHDVVAGHVMAMAIRAEAALSSPDDPPGDRAALRAVRDAGIDAHGALRTMISVLRRGGDDLLPIPRLDDLADVVRDARRAGLRVRLDVAELSDVDGATEQAVVRVVREALANCVRHSREADVVVRVHGVGDVVDVNVRSLGGRKPSPGYEGAGWGLSMLRERVAALGGTFAAGPDAEGWTVEARIPREVAA